MPAAIFVRTPVPEMSFETVTVPVRLICSVASLTTAPLPSDPVAPPAPTLRTPAEIVVVPL